MQRTATVATDGHPGPEEQPFWWRAAPRPAQATAELPGSADVAIVGSGITGLCASLVLARAGRSVALIEAGEIGRGASTRNAGYVSRAFKHRFGELAKRHGIDYAIRLYRELQAAVDSVIDTIAGEGIDCGLQMLGRFMPAASPADYEIMARDLEAQHKHLGFEFEMLPKARVREALATDVYAGGALLPDLGGLHPGLYHAGLLERARSAGVQLIADTPVNALNRQLSGRILVNTTRGRLEARDVIVATNGYTDGLVPWLRRRVIPFDAFMIATEPLAPERVKALIPHNRVCIDTSHNPLFVRPSPDGTRLLFGALTGLKPGGAKHMGARLMGMLRQLLPGLDGVQAEHSWTGRCAGTFDLYPHMGSHQGIHYALGYCFVGVPTGTYFGRKIAHAILGSPEAASIFANRPFPTIPFYSQRRWFLPAVLAYYKLMDRRTPSGAIA